MYIKKILVSLVAMIVAIGSVAQTQTGIVKTKGRMGSNGKVIAGKRLSGVAISVRGGSTTVSKAQGAFSLPLQHNTFGLSKVSLKGYELLDPELLSRQYTYSKSPLYILLETPEQRQQDLKKQIKTLTQKLNEVTRAKDAEIERLLEENKITSEEYRKMKQELYANQNTSWGLIDKMAEEYNNIDFDNISEFDARVADCIINGRLAEADSLLSSLGNVEQMIKEYNQLQSANAEAEQMLNKSKEAEAFQKDNIANICYRKFQIKKQELDFDSAAFYIKARADLDTMNIEWQYDTGHFLREYIADYNESLKYVRRSLNLSVTQFGENSIEAAKCLNSIGVIYYCQEEYEKALEMCQRSLDIYLSVLGENHINVADCYNNIGVIYDYQGKYARALEMHRESLDIRLSVLGEKHPDVAGSYNNIGVEYDVQGEYAKALEMYQKSLEIRLFVFGEKHIDVADSYNNIGATYYFQGEYEKALGMYRKAFDITLSVFGEKHLDMVVIYKNIGDAYYCQKEYKKAIEAYQKALDIRLPVLGENHPKIAECYYAIGVLYYCQHEDAKALEMYQKALEILLPAVGDNHSMVADIYDQIGIVCFCLGEFSKGLEMCEKARTIYQYRFGYDDVRVKKVENTIRLIKRALEN